MNPVNVISPSKVFRIPAFKDELTRMFQLLDTLSFVKNRAGVDTDGAAYSRLKP